MRDRRPLLGKSRSGIDDDAVQMPADDYATLKARDKKIEKREMRQGIMHYLLFLCLVLGLPLTILIYSTPFFIFENLKCRVTDKMWGDSVVADMEASYASYFSDPPLYLSEEYNRSVYWGTYEPSRIFALKNRAKNPVTVGLAWYDKDRAHPLRHHMPYTHNKVNAVRTASKKRVDSERMTVRWVTHDGLHYGKQSVTDDGNRATFDIEFLKSPSGNSWHVRIHSIVETPSPLEVVLYVVNADTEASLEVEAPDGHNDGDWSPLVKGEMEGPTGAREAFLFRVYDDHNPLFDTAPWRIYGLNIGGGSDKDEGTSVDDAFALTTAEVLGGTPAERAKTSGKGITGGRDVGELQRQRLDLRDLPSDAYTYIESADQATFTSPPNPFKAGHNVVVMKKAYTSSFRLEVSLRPATVAASAEERARTGSLGVVVPQYKPFTTCQLTNAFRRRDKAIFSHVRKVVRPWLQHSVFNVSTRLYEYLSVHVVSELFGSMYYGAGCYLQADPAIDKAWDQNGAAVPVTDLEAQLRPSSHIARAWAMVGSRTDEPVGQQHLTGLQLLFLTRWNKEIAKDILASWLLGAQDPETGFIPTRTTFSAAVRSTTAEHLRYEHITFGAPPTLLLGLEEVLNEMERKPARVTRHQQKMKKSRRKRRNNPEYVAEETEADRTFLQQLLPALKRWRAWWHRTQCSTIGAAGGETDCGSESRRPLEEWPEKPTGKTEDLLAYRWRSRDGPGSLRASGMEDYPRATCPGEYASEAHVDLFSWIALLSTLITRIEEGHLGIPASVKVDWEAYLDALHWDREVQRYADRAGCASGDFSPYTGYATLYPVMLGVVRRDMVKARATIDVAMEELWSKFGLMSVSFSSIRKARSNGVPNTQLWMGYVWPSTNLIFAYALKTRYASLLDAADANNTRRKKGSRGEMENMYEQLHVTMAETMRQGLRWWEFFNPVNGDGEGSKTYIGTYSLILGLLDDFS